jgi:hypothetical protein
MPGNLPMMHHYALPPRSGTTGYQQHSGGITIAFTWLSL